MSSAEKSARILNLVRAQSVRLQFRRSSALWFSALGITLLMFTGIIILEWWLWMPPLARLLLLASSLITAGWTTHKLRLRLETTDFKRYYRQLSDHARQPELRYVLDLMQIKSEDRAGLHDAALESNLRLLDLDTLRDSAATQLRQHPVTEIWQAARLTLAAGAILTAIFSIFQYDTTLRVLTPLTTYYQPNPFTYTITPGEQTLEQGTTQTFAVQFSGNSPQAVRLAVKTAAENEFRILPMNASEAGTFTSAELTLFDDVAYYLLMDRFRTPDYHIHVQLLPRFTWLEAEVTPPAYTRLDPVLWQYPFREIESYPGGEVTLRAQMNADTVQVQLYRRLADGPAEVSVNADREMVTTFRVSEPDSVWFSLTDASGLTNRNPFTFVVNTLTDAYPEIRIFSPEPRLSVLDPTALDVTYEARDDFGFSAVRLRYEVRRSFGTGGPETGSIRGTTPRGRAAVETLLWDVSTLRLLPQDEVVYWLEITDNDVISGYKTTRSDTRLLLIASLADVLLAQEEQESGLADRLEEFQQAYEDNRRELDALREQIQQNEGDNWEQSRLAEQIQQQREQLDEQLETIREQFEELTREMDSSEQLSQETQQMYEDLQQLMQEIEDPKIREALERLREGLENLDQNQVRDALQELNFNEDRYRERLERTLDLFKSLQLNAELDRLSAVLEDLAEQEDTLIGEALPDKEEQLQRQESIQDQLEQIQDRMETLPEKGPDRTREQIENLRQDLAQDISSVQEQLEQDMQELQQGGSGEQQPAQERREQIRDQLNEMRRKTQSAKAMMGQQGVQVNRQALLGIMQNLLLLSGAQETLITNTSELTQGSAAFVGMAREQRSISQAFVQITDSLYQVSREVPQFPNRLNVRRAEVQRNLENAVALLAERDRNRSVAEERVALGGMNDISSMLADLLDALNNSDSSGGGGGSMSPEQLLEQLQQMSGEQQQLNQQIQDMINDMAGERLMQDQMDRLDQMARQQNAIRQQLREIQQRGGLSPGDELLSELERLNAEMEDAINDLRGGVTEERVVVQRQQNILSRMLRAERALNEREQDEQRRGDRAGDPRRESPPELTLEELREQVRQSLQDPNQTRFSQEYQQLIQRYFELLEEAAQRRPR